MDRRRFLANSAFLGCSLAASPLATPFSFAAIPGDARLVVILLRGGMDGMAAVSPYGDPEFKNLRGQVDFGEDGYVDLDGFYAIHPAMRPLLPLWRQGDLGFVHAVSTPYRDKRSHFDGQSLLEAGGDVALNLKQGGWLNRMMAELPESGTRPAYAVGNDALSVLDGRYPVDRWSPDVDLALSPQALDLAMRLMKDEPKMKAALSTAYRLADEDGDSVAVEGGAQEMMARMEDNMQSVRSSGYENQLADFAARRLREEPGVASFSLNGWDTHINQSRVMSRPLTTLTEVVLTLKQALGEPVWQRTAIVAMTEFGRTARLNGTKGTDHGTGGAMVLAGGAIRGGKVYANWPGLTEADMYRRRDLMPTRDLRAYTGWIIRDLFGVGPSSIEQSIFPHLDLGENPKLVL